MHVRDVTTRQERDPELGAMRDRVDLALQSTDALLWEWSPDTDTAAAIYPSSVSLFDREIQSYEAFAELIHPDDRERVDETLESALESATSYSFECRIVQEDETRWLETDGQVLRDGQGDATRVVGVSKDITERKRRESRIAGLNELTTACLEADARQQIADLVVDRAAELLDMPVALVARYDERTNGLQPAAATPAAESALDVAGLLATDAPAWRAFAENESRRLPATADGIDAGCGPVGIWSLGRHGVFVASLDEPDGTVADAFGATVAATVQTALDSAERLQLFEEREARLTDLTDQLERVNRVNDVIRRIDRALVRTSTRSAIEGAVCEELARFEPYRFVVMSGYDQLEETVAAREWAGDERSYLDAVDLDAGPMAVAADTREPQVVQELLADPPLEPWREAALAREFGACLALPVTYGDSLYGVLTVFGDSPGLFDEMERKVLGELADNIAQTINAVETKRALVSDRVVELTFTTDSEDVPFVALATETGGTFAFESVVPRADDRFKAFFTVSGADADDVRAFLRQTVAIEEHQLITDRGDDLLFSGLLTEDSLVFHFVDHGVVPRELTATPGDGRLVVELSSDVDVRAVVETIEAGCPDVELVAKRTHERTLRTRQGFRSAVEDGLTDRQLEILQTAYNSGYFESPRASTGETVATSLDISQPTFANHLRAAHRKLLALLFDESR